MGLIVYTLSPKVHDSTKGIMISNPSSQASCGGSVVKNLPANAGEVGSILGSGRSPGGGNGNPLQYSCLENSMDRGALWLQFMGWQKSGI